MEGNGVDGNNDPDRVAFLLQQVRDAQARVLDLESELERAQSEAKAAYQRRQSIDAGSMASPSAALLDPEKQSIQTVKSIQAWIRGCKVRKLVTGILETPGGALVKAKEASKRGEHVVDYVWLHSGQLGLKIVPRGFTPEAKKGVIVSESVVGMGLPAAVKAGMLVESVDGEVRGSP